MKVKWLCYCVCADISQHPADGPAQPKLTRYPTKTQAGAQRAFRAQWFSQYDWLEYSQQADAAFCCACRHFPAVGLTCDVAFTSKGFSNWKKAYFTDGGFAVHGKSPAHIKAYVDWQEFKSGHAKPAVVDLLTDEHRRQINANRKYLSAVVDVLKFTAIHRLAQRGHDELDDSVNRGNFLDLLNVIGKYNDVVSHKLESGPGNAKYTSKDIQKEILGIMASMVQGSIAQEVRDSGEFSILADETKDCRKMEQMAIVLRYFRGGSIYESFVGFVQVSYLSAEGLSSKIIAQLQTLMVDWSITRQS